MEKQRLLNKEKEHYKFGSYEPCDVHTVDSEGQGRPGSNILDKVPFLSCFFGTKIDDFDKQFVNEHDQIDYKTMHFAEQKVVSRLDSKTKLIEIRKLMKKHGIGVYIVPSEDEHQSERTAAKDKRLEFVSNFTGGTGIAVITLDDPEELSGKAALSTDGRFFLQAGIELDPDFWTILKQNTVGYPTWTEFVKNEARNNRFSQVVSCDPRVISFSVGKEFEEQSSDGSFEFKPLFEPNLVDKVWGDERPETSSNLVYHLHEKYTGESVSSKLKRVRNKLNSINGTHVIISSLDEIAWVFNLRCDGDFEFSPFFHGYGIISGDGVVLYADESKIREVSGTLREFMVIKPYERFYEDVRQLEEGSRVVVPESCNYALISSICDGSSGSSGSSGSLVFNSIISYLKIYKNPIELENYSKAQLYDSLSFIIFSSWLEHELIVKKSIINEYEAACKLYSIRKQNPSFKSHSNGAISSSGPNSSIIHYAPSKTTNSLILPHEIYLVDSGAQYLEGTTDITRTYRFTNTNIQDDKKYYTLVLKGHLAVSMAKFPSGTYTGAMLDGFSREPLWAHGLDFNHGTGHGIASFGNIHEGPLFISTTAKGPNKEDIFKEGGLLTIEPGYYIDGVKGYRIESEIEIIKLEQKDRLGKSLLGFKYLTRIPFCRRLIDVQMLTEVEKEWVNWYYQLIRKECGERLLEKREMMAYDWVMRETEPI